MFRKYFLGQHVTHDFDIGPQGTSPGTHVLHLAYISDISPTNKYDQAS